jgi:hypothetical protein
MTTYISGRGKPFCFFTGMSKVAKLNKNIMLIMNTKTAIHQSSAPFSYWRRQRTLSVGFTCILLACTAIFAVLPEIFPYNLI